MLPELGLLRSEPNTALTQLLPSDTHVPSLFGVLYSECGGNILLISSAYWAVDTDSRQ
jgi:hypothetical protein